MGKEMDLLGGDGRMKYDASANGKAASFEIQNANMIMHQNLFFDRSEIKWYDHFNRYGYIDPYNTDQVIKEFLFFTKPDLNIFNATSYKDCNADSLNDSLKVIPFFRSAATRHKDALLQLQYGVKNLDGIYSPFMNLLTNAATGKMDLPSIQSETQSSTPNIYGTVIDYRSHSVKSDNAFDFSISFMDTAYLEIYTLAKAYDEYMRMVKMGEVQFNDTYKEYIKARVIPEQFSVYKFLIGTDGETILYYAKATGCFFVDVPRSDFGDPPNDGFKFSLSFHANFIEDNNPLILSEFNKISPVGSSDNEYVDVYNEYGFNNSWAKYPCIRSANASYDKRVARRGDLSVDYRLKWVGANSKYDDNAYTNLMHNAAKDYSTDAAASAAKYGNKTLGTQTVTFNNPNYYNAGLRISGNGIADNRLYDSTGKGYFYRELYTN